MKTLMILLICLSCARNYAAPECKQTALSKKYIYSVKTVKSKDADNELRISQIYVRIISKASEKPTQKIFIKPELLFSNAYTNCSAVKSFITGKNAENQVTDNDFGDFIVADFNFDGKEDFAVKRDSGGNGGAFYAYYIQNKSGKFVKESFLTDEIGYFPGTIDAKKKRLITYIHANAAGYNENIYKYNPATKEWIFLRQTYRKVG